MLDDREGTFQSELHRYSCMLMVKKRCLKLSVNLRQFHETFAIIKTVEVLAPIIGPLIRFTFTDELFCRWLQLVMSSHLSLRKKIEKELRKKIFKTKNF